MKKVKLFFIFHAVNHIEKMSDNLYKKIGNEWEKQENRDYISSHMRMMYKRYLKLKSIQWKLKNIYLNLAITLI